MRIYAILLYIQELTGAHEIQVVYWTLTYEIQFYLFFAASMMFDRRGSLCFYLALLPAMLGHHWAPHGLFLNLWHGFFLGVLAYRAGHLRQSAWPLLLLSAVTLVFRHGNDGVFDVPLVAAALVLFAAARLSRLSTSLTARPWQSLGAISYSLYLVHVPTLMLLSGAWQRIAGRGEIPDTLGGIVLLSACLVVAVAFHLAIERPSHRIAKQLFRKPARPLATAPV